MDIAVFLENTPEKNLNTVKLKSLIELDLHIITTTEFLEMLKNKEENLGKQIARKHLAIHNQRIFYDLINEGMNNGFRI